MNPLPKRNPLRWLPVTVRGHVLLVLWIMVLGVLVAAMVARTFSQQVEAQARSSLGAIAESQRVAVTNLLRERDQDALLFSQRRVVQEYLGGLAGLAGRRAEEAALRQALQGLRQAYGYRDVRLFAPDLRTLMALQPAPPLPAELAALRAARDTRQRRFVDLHATPDGQVLFGVVAPVFAAGNPSGRLLGLVYLQLDARDALYPLLARWPLQVETGESLLLRREGADQVRYLSPLRFRSESPRKPLSVVRRIPDRDQLLPAPRAAADALVVQDRIDYRSVRVLSVLTPVPGADWFLQVKVDHAEYTAPVSRLLAALLLLLLGILALLVVAAAMVVRGQRAERVAAEAAHDARHAAARRTLLEGYLEVDDQGRIVEVNEVLGAMLGYSSAELVGKPLSTLEAWRSQVELDAFFAALRAHGAERFRSRLKHRHGGQVNVEISAAYLASASGGRFFAAVRDVGPELEAQARIERRAVFYAFLGHANAAVFPLRDAGAIVDVMCREAVQYGGLVAARACLEPTPGQAPVLVAAAGVAAREALGRPDMPRPACAEAFLVAMRERRILYSSDVRHDGAAEPWHEIGPDVASAALVPIVVKGRAIGVLGLYAGIARYFDDEFQDLLEEVAYNLTLVIEAAIVEAERDRAVAEVARREAQLRQTLEASPLPVMVFSLANRRLQLVNRAFVECFGYHQSDIPDEATWARVAFPDPGIREQVVARWQVEVARAVQEGSASVMASPEMEMCCADGTRRTARGFMSVTGDNIVVQWEDLTDIRQAEEALRDSEQGFRGLIEETFTGIYVYQDARIVYANPRMTDITGWNVSELLGHDSLEFFDAETVATVQRLRAQLYAGKTSVSAELPFRCKDGHQVQLSFHVAQSTWNRRQALVAMVYDITERKRSEARIADYVRQLENTMQGTLQAVSVMVEMRDPYTAGHQRRVGLIAAAIGREMGWTEEHCRWLADIGLVHDIGKVAVPAEILSKPGRLTDLELRLVREHAQKGYDILRNVDFPLPIADIVHQHHERLDGSGYPRGLKGDAILPEARVLAVADVLESMASHRPYRVALGMEAALAELEKHRGHWFDPVVVDAIARMVREKGFQLPE